MSRYKYAFAIAHLHVRDVKVYPEHLVQAKKAKSARFQVNKLAPAIDNEHNRGRCTHRLWRRSDLDLSHGYHLWDEAASWKKQMSRMVTAHCR